tara:strand:- start:41 stop:364 length:324 start_codon:yes stop_codon:yes gene_type:complete
MAYHIVKTSAPGIVTNCTAATDVMIGVFTDGVGTGTATRKAGVSVAISGIAKIKAGAGVTIGSQVTSDGSGRAIHSVGGNSIIGRALSAGGANEIIEVLLIPGLKHV